jgi:hypothetical protein
MHARGNVLDGRGRLLAQLGGDLQFGGVILSAGLQILLAPAVKGVPENVLFPPDTVRPGE